MPTVTPALEASGEPDGALSRSYRGGGADGGYDEMVDARGGIRPHWATFVDHVDRMGTGELAARWERAQQLIHDNGVSFNVYGDPQGMERPWPLSPLPVLLGPAEFAGLQAGIDQRARLLDAVLR